MDNFKIKVSGLTDTEKLKVIEDLVFLGYKKHTDDWKPIYVSECGFYVAYAPPNKIEWDTIESWKDHHVTSELTLPKLRDLVVLKRNDVKDATHIDPEDGLKYVNLSGKWHWFNDELCEEFPDFGWHESANTREHDDHALKPINSFKDQGLISGAEAKLAWATGEQVECISMNEWHDITDEMPLSVFDRVDLKFRLKPQTIKLDIEIPAPYKAKIGGRDDTSFVLNVGRHQYLYQNEDDYTKARNALEAVFDAALGGNNS